MLFTAQHKFDHGPHCGMLVIEAVGGGKQQTVNPHHYHAAPKAEQPRVGRIQKKWISMKHRKSLHNMFTKNSASKKKETQRSKKFQQRRQNSNSNSKKRKRKIQTTLVGSAAAEKVDDNAVEATALTDTFVPGRHTAGTNRKRHNVKALRTYLNQHNLDSSGFRDALEDRIIQFHHRWHKEEGTKYFDSVCFETSKYKFKISFFIFCSLFFFWIVLTIIFSLLFLIFFLLCVLFFLIYNDSEQQVVSRPRSRTMNDDTKRASKIQKNRRHKRPKTMDENHSQSRSSFHSSGTSVGKNKDWSRTCPLARVFFLYPNDGFFACCVQSIDNPRRFFDRIGCRVCAGQACKYPVQDSKGNKGMGVPGELNKIKRHQQSSQHQRNLKKYRINQKVQKSMTTMTQQDKKAVSRKTLAGRARLLAIAAKDGYKPTTVFSKVREVKCEM